MANNNKLQPTSRFINRILTYNICPKPESYNYYFSDLATCVYAIMDKFEVNWARIMFDILFKEPFTFLSYGAFLTHVFHKLKINATSEINVVKVFEPFE